MTTLREVAPRAPGCSGADRPALHLAQTTPDTVRLVDAQSVIEALFAHGAHGAYGFCLPLPGRSRFFALKMRGGKKYGCGLTAASRSGLPVFWGVQGCHFGFLNSKVVLTRAIDNRQCE